MELMDIVKPVVDFIGGIRIYWGGFVLFGDSHHKLKGPHLRAVLDCIQPGDLVLRRFDNYVSSFFIKGRFSHIGIYIGENSVVHVGGDGIKKEDVLTFLRADDGAIVRPKDKTLVIKAINKARVQLDNNVEYDYFFDTDCPKKFYCSEFTDYCYGYMLKPETDGIIYPDAFMGTNKFEVVWDKK
jgi:hypothetical protein